MQALPQALTPLAQYKQFIIYKTVPKSDRPGKTDKLPLHPITGDVTDAHNPNAWLDHQTALQLANQKGQGYGVGFVFTATDPFYFVDIDNCLQADNTWSPTAIDLCTRLAGAAVEVSQSGKGLHIIGTADNIPPHGCRNKAKGLELYHEGRFVALTGTHAIGSAATNLNGAFTSLVNDYFPPASHLATRPHDWTTAPRPDWHGPTDDDQLITKMLHAGGNIAGQVFGNKASLVDLWHADIFALNRAFPDTYGQRAYDASSADAALASHLAFWAGGDCARIERLMRRSGLLREKWDQHTSYLQRTIVGAVSRCNNVYSDIPKQHATAEQPVDTSVLTMPAGGKGNTTLEVACVLSNTIKVAMDEFKQRIVLLAPTPWRPTETRFPRNWTDTDTIELHAWLQAQTLRPSKDAVFDAVVMIAERNRSHPVRNYLNILKWDGKPRIDGWLNRYLGVRDSTYASVVGAKFLISAVARIFEPGCKVDHVLILEGLQGIGKSTAVTTLLPTPDWCTDELPDVTNKDAAIQLNGAWIVEIAELDAMRRAEASSIKKFITRRIDRYRPPHGRVTVDIPRQCVFIGTDNEVHFKDQTGNRRFWPVECGECDIIAMSHDRDQLWAEAVSRYRAGEKWWLTREQELTLAQPEQEARRERDPWEDQLANWLGFQTAVSTAMVMDQLQIPVATRTAATGRRVATMLRKLGWGFTGKKQRGQDGYPVRIFYKTN